jgi:hypothetical protein
MFNRNTFLHNTQRGGIILGGVTVYKKTWISVKNVEGLRAGEFVVLSFKGCLLPVSGNYFKSCNCILHETYDANGDTILSDLNGSAYTHYMRIPEFK